MEDGTIDRKDDLSRILGRPRGTWASPSSSPGVHPLENGRMFTRDQQRPQEATFRTILLPNEFSLTQFCHQIRNGGLTVFQSLLDFGIEEGLGPCHPCPLGWLQGEREPVCGRWSPPAGSQQVLYERTWSG